MSEAYREFIARKRARGGDDDGIRDAALPDRLFAHQAVATRFALERRRAALFLATGLGKSGCAAAWADAVSRRERRPVLILTPLAVAPQMRRECEAFGVDAEVVRGPGGACPVQICNYERMHGLDPDGYAGVVCDESSILKSFDGRTRTMLTERFARTPWRLCCTATPSPNDIMELTTHSEFLGRMGRMEMLCRWFVNDAGEASRKWRLKGHAAADFWRWTATWAMAMNLPSDVGGCDDGYVLDPISEVTRVVDADAPTDGALFRLERSSATSMHAEKRASLDARCGLAAEIANAHDGAAIVWCQRNDESTALARAIPDAVEVHGSLGIDEKEARLTAFAEGRERVLVTKPRMAGFGLNLQHVDCQVFASLNHSFEQYYQAVRRSWRFGQERPVTVHRIVSVAEQSVISNIERKSRDHETMCGALVAAMQRETNA